MASCLYVTSFARDSDSKESAFKAGDPGLIPGLRKSPGERNGNLLQYSCLENSMDRGDWWATVHGVTKSQTGLSNTFTLSVLKGAADLPSEEQSLV